MGKTRENIFLIDGNAFCYRAFYAIRDLVSSKGMPTNAIFGVVNMLRKLSKEYEPDMMAVVFDVKGPTVRHLKYKEYKVQRKPMPDDLIVQIPRIKEVIAAYNIPMYEMQGQEADDVIATLALQAKKKGLDVMIVTSDKDALQLVDDDIKVLSPHMKEGKIYDRSEVLAKYGVEPGAMIELMALAGDASDNVPGVKGVGLVTARKLIEEYGSVDDVYKNIDKISSKALHEKLVEDKKMALLSKELVTLETDLPVKLDIKDVRVKSPDNKKLAELYREFEFRGLMKEVMPRGEDTGPKTAYSLCSGEKDIEEVISGSKTCKEIAINIEFVPETLEVEGVAFSWEEGGARYIPNIRQGGSDKIHPAVKDILEDKEIKKTGYDLKKSILAFNAGGIKPVNMVFDVLIADYLLEPSLPGHDLGGIAFRRLGYGLQSESASAGWDEKGQGTLDFSKDRPYKPACERADIIYRLKGTLEAELKKKKLEDLFGEVEMPLIPVLASMESEGVKIDIGYVEKMSLSLEGKLKDVVKKIYELAGEEFNINSPKQLQYILFEKIGLPSARKIKTGVSTDEAVLRKLAGKHELPAMLLEYRTLNKFKTTYYDAILKSVDRASGKLHTHFNQAVTATGRLSSSEPNLQNIPVKTPLGREIRKAFIPENKNRVMISADYSQIELRILAHLSGDKNLMKAFEKKEDIHKFTASLVFDIPVDEVTDEMRSMAKTVNFGVIYGMGPFRLAKDLGITMEESRTFIESYFSRYSGVKKFIDATLASARKKGYVTTILNRRRYIPEISSSSAQVKSFAERVATNTPLQGSSADLIKLAMLACRRETADTPEVKMILQVHDELIFTVPASGMMKIAEKIKRIMEKVIDLKVPLVVDMKHGGNWMDLEEVSFERK